MLPSAHCPASSPVFSRNCRQAHALAYRILTLVAAMLCAVTAHAETHRLPLFVDATTSGQTGVLRIHNESSLAGTVSIYAINDSGSKSGPATLTLRASAAAELDADDIESGDSAKGVSGGVGTITGDVRLEIVTDISISALAYLRTSDGTQAVLHDEVAARATASGYEYRVPVFNPAQNMAQASSLRLINPTSRTATLKIEGRDDSGATAASGSVSLALTAGGARTLTAQQLEAGGSGLTGQLGAGSGKWRLVVSADQPVEVVSLVTSSTGRMDNLSSAGRDGLAPHDHAVFSERFVGEVIATRSEDESGRLSIQAADNFSETMDASDGSSNTRSGTYAYKRASRDAGELTLNYSQGDPCVANLHFASRTDGWYASRCGTANSQQATWQGGSWTLADAQTPPDPGDGGLRFPAAGRPGDRNYTLNEVISTLILPRASGGTGTLTYSLAPAVPGLSFDSATRRLTGTPTLAGVNSMTYTATDADSETATLRFLIVVRDADSEDCLLGLKLSAGESCNYPGTTDAFTVKTDGSASFLIINSTRAINLPNRTYQGKVYDFRASHQGDGIWRIDRLQGDTAPEPDTVPSIAQSDAPGNQTYTTGTAIARLTLPGATQGNGALSYSLTPSVPGLNFNAATRQLSGTPTKFGTYSMTYRVTDEDGDSSSVSFTITVQEPPPPVDPGSPDLIVTSASVNDNTVATGQNFMISVKVSNQGDGESPDARLRYYQSSDSTITTSDTEVGNESIGSLAAAQSKNETETVLSPSTAGTYYYGACADVVANESDTTNNCSNGVRVTVSAVTGPVQGRDLIVQSPGVTDSTPTVGQAITLSVTVRNQGAESTPSTTLRYYISNDATISTSDTQEGTDTVGTLAASGTSYESVRISVPSTPGVYYYGACVVAVANEANTTNNCSTAIGVRVSRSSGGGNNPGGNDPGSGTTPTRSPDLTVDSASVSVSSGDPDFQFNLTVRVRNRGNTSSQAATLTYYQSSDSRISTSDTIVGTAASVAALAASATQSFTLSQSAPSNTGTYYYGACVNYVVNEQNTNNNCSSGARIRVQKDGADLRVDSVSVSDSTPTRGGTFTLRARVRNIGNLATTKEATLTYYESLDAIISSSDTKVGTADSISTLLASQSSSQNSTVTAQSSVSIRYYGACVSGHSNDTNPDNNCSTGVRVKIPGADLVVQSPKVSDATPEPGGRFTLNVVVRNNGVREASGTTLDYYLSDDDSTIDRSDLSQGTDSVSSLGRGRTDDETINLTAPTDPGTYYYGACVQSVYNEDDTSNNCSAGVKVTVFAPDLVVQSPWVEDSTPEAGDRFTLRVTVANIGGSESPSTTLDYYRSSNAEIGDADDKDLKLQDTVSSLDAGKTRTESTSVTAPEKPGTYYYGACVNKFPNESDTTNNCSKGLKVVVPAPDLIVDSVRVDDSTPETGERFELSVRVRNQGKATAESTTLTYYLSDNAKIPEDDIPQGTDGVAKLDPSESDNESIRVTAPEEPGTYYYGACVNKVPNESDTTNNCSKAVRVTVPAPDLVVDSARVDDSTVAVGDDFQLSVRVRNRGGSPAASTTLTYYESDDIDINPSDGDAMLGTDTVNELDPSESTTESIQVRPLKAGTYYYGACVAVHDHESNARNICSSGARVIVRNP